jgi:hypothetical protein
MARARKTTAAKTDTEGAALAPVTPAAEEQAGHAGEAAAVKTGGLSGGVSASGAVTSAAPGFTQVPWQDPSPQVTPRDQAGVMLTVTGPKRGRRRAGRQFGPEPVLIAAADLSEAARLALEADPALKIVVSTS